MAAIQTILRTNQTTKRGTNSIVIRLSHNRKAYYFPILKFDKRFSVKPTQWNNRTNRLIESVKINPNYKILNKIIREREHRFQNIVFEYINSDKEWSINLIKERFYNLYDSSNVYEFIENEAKAAHEDDKMVDYENLKRTITDLKEFTKSKPLSFVDIDYAFVNKMITFHRNKKRNNTTIGIRLTYLRKVLNASIDAGVGNRSTYPFSKVYGAKKYIKVHKFLQQERKIAIDLDVVDLIKTVRFDNMKMEQARRMFIASYAARGMTFRDMANIKERHFYLVGDKLYINYNRNKTDYNLNFKVSPLFKEQIDWFKKNSLLRPGYVFPIRAIKKTEKEIENNFKYISNEMNKFNYALKKIAKALDIKDNQLKLSSYVSRHSYATNLHNNGVNTEEIGQTLGHQSPNTTRKYLKSFTEEQISGKIESIIG